MTEPQMMAACPKYDENDVMCRSTGSKCPHSGTHAIRSSCSDGSDTRHCPACTPLAAPATQPPRLSARERIEREAHAGYAYLPTKDLLAAAERVIAACDAECDDWRETVAAKQSKIESMQISFDTLHDGLCIERRENATLRATVERLQHEADRTVSEEIEKNEALVRENAGLREMGLAAENRCIEWAGKWDKERRRADALPAPADPQERYRERLDATFNALIHEYGHGCITDCIDTAADSIAQRDAHIAARVGKASD